MKKNQIIYWVFTSIVAVMMTFSAYMYITSPLIKAAFVHLGFPDYFRIELAIFKILGAIVLLAPLPARLKEWAYAGFTITYISAITAHTSVDGIQTAVGPIVFLVLLAISYFYFRRVSEVQFIKA